MHYVYYKMALAGSSWEYGGYVESTSARQAVVEAQQAVGPNAESVLTALLKMHPPSTVCIMLGARAVRGPTNVPVPRDYYSTRIYAPGTASALLPDVTNSSLKVELYGNTPLAAKRTLDLSGLPDSWIRRLAGSGAANIDANMHTRMRELVQAVAARGWRIKRTDDPLPSGISRWFDVKSLSAEPGSDDVNTVVELREAPTPAWTAGQQIDFGRNDDCEVAGLNGHHTILSPVMPAEAGPPALGFRVIVNTRYRGKTTSISPFGLRVRLLQYQFIPVVTPAENEVIGFSLGTRQRGARRDEGRGRARSKSCRH